jgi:hypothetical protein
MPDVGDKVARRDSMGTVIMTFPVDEPPAGFEGAWPGSPPRRLAVVAWPGRKKLAVIPASELITIPT